MLNEAVRLFDSFCAGFIDKNLQKALEVFSNNAKFLAPGVSEMSGKKR